ncbi:hypothetical protein KAR91_47860 [Candidatus Pacearchaeota archaeon]|nr:hypothetical protein [Candidatus Pacearchaeota archaeon]
MTTEPVTIEVPISELNKMFDLIKEALKPQIEFNEDFDKMKEEAERIKNVNMSILWAKLSKLTKRK